MTKLPLNTILQGDVLTRLVELPKASVDCVITSPPYFQLRDYGVAGQLGLEATVEDWVQAQLQVTRQLARVLKPTGSFWLNLGDSFSRHHRYGAAPKGLLLAPERLLLALAADGWIVRNKVIWAKSNAMPTSVGDRLALTYEVVYFFVRSHAYFFDLNAIREPHLSTPKRSTGSVHSESFRGPLAATRSGLVKARAEGRAGHPLGKNPGDVWTIPTRGFRGAHFATFPEQLLVRPLLATCPESVCVACGAGWRHDYRDGAAVLVPCGCGAPTRPGVVLDPFFGTGTVGVVARKYERDWLGIELNPAYITMAERRLGQTLAYAS